jgi:hypothetical protein
MPQAQGSTKAAIPFYTVSDISENRSLTPEGFLLCRNVPIARTGTQLYGADEVPIEGDGIGLVKVDREESEVFRPETIASFAGKPVTLGHPPMGVTPDNWKEHAVGVVQNPHRGTGIDDDLLYGDLLITDKTAIEAIEDGTVEVSCGYDAEYEQSVPGRGRQFNIIGNHVALVDNGRCGPRCAIQDRRTIMSKTSVKDRILAAFKTRDVKILDEALNDLTGETEGQASGTGSTINIHLPGAGKTPTADCKEEDSKPMTVGDFTRAMDAYMAARDKKARDEEEEEEKKKKEKEREKEEDSEYEKKEGEKESEYEKRTGDAMKNLQAQAEIILPGFRVPTVDCKCKDRKVRDQVTDIKRRVLHGALATEDGRKAAAPILAGRDIDTLPAMVLDAVFAGVSEVSRALNNARIQSRGNTATNDNGTQTIDAFKKGGIDQINQNFWKNQKGA